MTKHKLTRGTAHFSFVMNTSAQANQSGSVPFNIPEIFNPANILDEEIAVNRIIIDKRPHEDINTLAIDHESCSVCAWPGDGSQECCFSLSSEVSSSEYHKDVPVIHVLIPSLYKGPVVSASELPPFAVAVDMPEDGSEPKFIFSEYLQENYVPYAPYEQLPNSLKDLSILRRYAGSYPINPEGCAEEDGECVPPMMPIVLLEQFSIILP